MSIEPIGWDPNNPLTGQLKPSWAADVNSLVVAAQAALKTIYVPFPRQTEFHARCDHLIKLGEATRGQPQSGLRVLAPPGSGKTTAARELVRLIELSRPKTEHHIPVIHIPLESATTARKLMVSLLGALNDPHANKGNEMVLRNRAYEFLRRVGTVLLIVDEVQHLQSLARGSQEVTDSLKQFLDAGIVPIVFLGTEDATDMFVRNRQLAGRLRPPCDFKALSRVDADDRALFGGFVHAVDVAIVEKGIRPRHAGLSDPWIRGCLHEACGGVIGQAFRLIENALEHSVRRSADCIEVYDLAAATDQWAVGPFVDRNPFRVGGSR